MKKILPLVKLLSIVVLSLLAINSFAQTITIGSGTIIGNKLPVAPYFGYSYSQQIILKSDITTAGNITKIRFYSNGNALTNSNGWTIYLGHTTKTVFANNTDWILSGAMTQVFSGTVSAAPASGWMEITLTTPFAYNNVDNLVVAVDENTASYTGAIGTNYFRIWTTPTTNRAIYYNNDITNPDPSNITLTGTRTAYINQMQLVIEPPCSGSPAPGNTVAATNPVVSGGTTALSLQNATSGSGVTYQWKQSADGTTYTNSTGTGNTSASYTATVTAKTWFKCTVTCSGNSMDSTPVIVNLKYCDSLPTSNDGQGVTNVKVGTTIFGVGDVFYYNYNTQFAAPTIPDLTQGALIPSSVSFATGYEYDTHIWIDFNDNGIFDSSEKVYTGVSVSANPTTLDTSFTLPTGASLGQHQMRIGTADNGQATPNPCYSGAYGVTIDLMINIVAPVPCSGTPIGGTVTVAPISGASGSTYGVTATGYSTGFGLSYQWQYSDTGGTPWTNQGAATSSYAALTGLVAPAFGVVRTWKLVVTCTVSVKSADSATGTFTSGYCVPSGTTSYWITNFTTTGGVTNITNTTANSNIYGDYSATKIVSQYAGSSLDLAIATNSGTHYFYGWVDWNNDGDFVDGGEAIFSTTSYAASYSANYVIPIAQAAGNYRMRISNSYLGTITSCSAGGYSEYEDYTLTILSLPACSGTPNAGTGLVNGLASNTGTVSSSITLSASGLSVALGLTYQWYSSPDGTTWTAITGGTTATYGTTSAATFTTTYYQLRTTCTNSNITSTSSNAILVTTYCSSTVNTSANAGTNYIKEVDFLGTLLDTFNSSGAATTAPFGYTDFTGLTPKSIQADGNGMNIYIASNNSAFYRVWVDWNKDGTFDNTAASTERVYDSGSVLQASTTAGVVIPADLAPGDYTMRIRVNGYTSGGSGYGNPTSSPCDVLDYPGETEDYTFTVIANCAANILTAPRTPRCGSGSVALEPTATAGTTEFRWYTTETGGSPISASVATGTTTITTSYSTPSITTTTTYYVTAWNGTCESLIRTPMVAVINQTPNITFSPSSAEVCGFNSTIALSATGSNEIEYLINENFESTAGLNGFTNNRISGGGGTNADAAWQLRSSVFKPSLFSWFPAISSGINGNRFVLATSDVGSTRIKTENALVSPLIDTTTFLNLTLSFKMYYSRYFTNGTTLATDFVNIEVSTDGGLTYPNVIQNITADVGIGTKFEIKTYDLSAYIGQSNLRFRIRYHGEFCDGVAIDNIDLYGEKPLQPSFTYSSINPIGIFTDAAGTNTYLGQPISTVYFKPSPSQIENYDGWNITATATLNNSCSAVGYTTIVNNSKFWNSASSDWNSTNWTPNSAIPTADKCVIIKTPVILGTGAEGFAKNIKIEAGGKLTIKKDQTLNVIDEFIKDAAVPAGDVLIESDGNLIQTNEGVNINSGDITAKRIITLSTGRQQYNYLISPLENQNLTSIYKDASGNPVTVPFVLYHNEATNKFYTSSGAYIKGRGLTVKEPTSASFGAGSMGATFGGKPTNGAFTYPIVNSDTGNTNRGYNLIGNPYPSNIDMVKFYTLNGGATSTMSATAYFWDNRANNKTSQEGNSYTGQSYGQLNMTTGTGTAGTGDIGATRIPTQYVKTGQAFMVKSKTASTIVSFNNTIRTKLKGNTDFFGKDAQKDENLFNRYWLNMISPQNIASNIAVVYFAEGNNGFTEDDSRTMGGSDVIYSIVGNENVSINGRSDFINTDTILLGTNHFAVGTYTIALGGKEGIFDSAQNIYLKDKQTGTLTNLSAGNYTFTATAGETTGRFEIVYVPETVLATDAAVKENLIVYRDGDDFVVKVQTKKITSLEMFDTAGRLILTLNPNSTKAIIPAEKVVNGVYVLKINQNGQITSKKIIR